LFADDGRTLLINSPQTVEAAQAIADLYLKDHVSPNPATGLGMDSGLAMLSGRVAMQADGAWMIGTTYSEPSKEGLNYGIGVLPKFKTPVTHNGGSPMVVFRTTKNPNEAKEYLRWCYNPEFNLESFRVGINMPVHMNWYTNEQLFRRWADGPNRPPLEEFRDAAANFSLNYTVQAPQFYFAGWPELSDLLTPALDPVWQGTQTARQALDAVYPALQQVVDRHR
jgi:multiple sugar transport system substrate-binding protein